MTKALSKYTICLLAQSVLIVEFREGNDICLNQLKATAFILNLLLRITGEKRQCPSPHSEGVLARGQRDKVNYLLRQLLSSNYSRGALDITSLCLAWENYNHPAREDVLVRLCEIGSRQRWFLPTPGPDPPPPRRGSRYVGFADEDSDTDLEQRLGSLSLETRSTRSANTVQADIDEEEALLLRLQTRLSRGKARLETIEQTAATLSSRVHLNINLQISATSADRIELSTSIAELARDMYEGLLEAISLAQMVPTILAGDVGLYRGEEQPKRSLFERYDGGDILDRFIGDTEPLVNTGFRCSLLLSGLLAQGKLLLPKTANLTDNLEVLLELPADLGEYVEHLNSGLVTLLALQGQLDGRGAVDFECQTTPFPKRYEGGLRGVWETIPKDARLRQFEQGGGFGPTSSGSGLGC